MNSPDIVGGHLACVMLPWECYPAWRSIVPLLRRAGCCRSTRAASLFGLGASLTIFSLIAPKVFCGDVGDARVHRGCPDIRRRRRHLFRHDGSVPVIDPWYGSGHRVWCGIRSRCGRTAARKRGERRAHLRGHRRRVMIASVIATVPTLRDTPARSAVR